MPVCQFGHFPSAGCTLQEAFLDKKGFVYFFYRAGVFSQCRSNGGQSYRTAPELVDDGAKQLVVYLVQAVTVYVQCLQCELGNLQVSRTRRSKALAIRGVPRLREAISPAASVSQGTPSIFAERKMILVSVLSS